MDPPNPTHPHYMGQAGEAPDMENNHPDMDIPGDAMAAYADTGDTASTSYEQYTNTAGNAPVNAPVDAPTNTLTNTNPTFNNHLNNFNNNPVNPSTNAAAVAGPPFVCHIDGCRNEAQQKWILAKHQRYMHLGTRCYWRLPSGRICGCSTMTPERLREHLVDVHIRGVGIDRCQQTEKYLCPWPGNPGIPTRLGGLVAPEGPCLKTFASFQGAENHARRHQHEIWVEVEGISL
ncbi:hypothetical protein F5X97DRAFT_341852 [Nemania serpens]|nr:hypothetical protein F5X97DRAFT_341852 [Nemania serpens]